MVQVDNDQRDMRVVHGLETDTLFSALKVGIRYQFPRRYMDENLGVRSNTKNLPSRSFLRMLASPIFASSMVVVVVRKKSARRARRPFTRHVTSGVTSHTAC